MKVLPKAKQLLQGFVLPELSFRPSGFLPRQSLALFSGMTRRKKAKVLTGFGSLALVGSFVAGSLLASGTTQLGVDSTIDYTANLSATSNTTILSPTSLDSRLAPTGTNSFSLQMWVNPGSATANASERILVNMEHKYAILVSSGRWQYWVGNG